MSGLFEHLAATDDSALIAQRQATAVANKRIKDRFGAFLANAGGKADFAARLALVDEDITEIVSSVTSEYGGDARKIEAAIRRSMGTLPGQAPGSPMGGAPMGPDGMAPAAGGGATCPQCGGPMVNGQCPTCGGAGGAPGGAYGLNHNMPQTPSTGPIMSATKACGACKGNGNCKSCNGEGCEKCGGSGTCPGCGGDGRVKTSAGGFCDKCHAWKSGPKAGCTCDGDSNDDAEPAEPESDDSREASTRVARRPKMCPYHSEVTDIALGSGDPQAGFNAMAAHAWGDKHCKGGYQGTCNFRPAMVTQKYWDEKANEYDERRQQRELERSMTPQDLSLDTEPIMHAEPLPDEPGKEGVSDLDGELANAPSAVGAGELAMASSTKKAEALKTEKLPTGNDTALGGPSPKIDKSPSGDQNGWSLDPIDTQMDGSPHPSIEQDPTAKPDYGKEDFLDQTDAVTESEKSWNSDDLMDGGGYNTEKLIKQYPTKTWSGQEGQHKPVTQEALSSVDPDRNPIRTILEEYEGFLMPNQVESAVRAWERA